MWNWIKSFFNKKEEDKFDLYKPSERGVYSYYKGYTPDTLVRMDPMVLWVRLQNKSAEISQDWGAAHVTQSKFSEKARASLMNNIREIFELKPWGEGGLSDWDARDLLIHFWVFSGMIKKNSNQSQMSSNSTEDSTSSGNENPPTSPSSDSGSVKNDPPTEMPPPLPSV